MKMNQQFSHVLSPIRINGVLFKNRIISAPITPHSSSNGELYPNEDAMTYFEDRARPARQWSTAAAPRRWT